MYFIYIYIPWLTAVKLLFTEVTFRVIWLNQLSALLHLSILLMRTYRNQTISAPNHVVATISQ